MDIVFVKLNVDLKCSWEGLAPDYRIWVDDELFTERTYHWNDPFYLREILQVEAESEKIYTVKIEPVGPQLSEFTFENPQVEYCDRSVRIMPHCDRPKTEFIFKVRP